MGHGNGETEREVRVITEEERRLFDKLIMPNLEIIKNLVIHYTNNYQDVDDNLQYVLGELAKGVSTYDGSKPLSTWIHVCVKHGCKRQNLRKARQNAMRTGLTLDVVGSSRCVPTVPMESSAEFIDSLSDEMRDALLSIPPLKLSPFLLQAQGFSIKEITKMEVESGNLAEYSEYTIKSRIFWARNRLKQIMSQHGYH